MAYLSISDNDPAGEGKPLEPMRATASGAGSNSRVAWSIAITLTGWIVLSPAALVYGGFWLMALAMGSGSSSDGGYELRTLAMIASAMGAPLLLGFALHRRNKTLWILGALATIPALVGTIYVVTA